MVSFQRKKKFEFAISKSKVEWKVGSLVYGLKLYRQEIWGCQKFFFIWALPESNFLKYPPLVWPLLIRSAILSPSAGAFSYN